MGIVSFVMALTLPLVSVVFALFPFVYLLNLYIDTILQKNGIPSSSILIPYFIEIHDGFDFATFAKTFLIAPIGLVLCFMTYFSFQGLVTFSRDWPMPSLVLVITLKGTLKRAWHILTRTAI